MKKKEHSRKAEGRSVAFRGGFYSLAVSAVVLAILVAVNIFASALPANLTQYDISSGKLYSLTSNTKAVAQALTQDVTIYWIVQSDEEDSVLEQLLAKYDSLSDHVSVVKKNPDIYPTFAQQYTDESVPNNSLIVESGERSRFISGDDLYVTEMDANYNYTTASYDSLRHQEIFSGSFEQIRQLDIALEGETYTIPCEVTEDEESDDGELLYTYFYGDEEIDAGSLESALTTLEATSFTDETPGETEEIGLTLTLDNENIPEVALSFYRYDGSSCLAVVDGEPVALVPRYQVVDLIEAVHAIVLDSEAT